MLMLNVVVFLLLKKSECLTLRWNSQAATAFQTQVRQQSHRFPKLNIKRWLNPAWFVWSPCDSVVWPRAVSHTAPQARHGTFLPPPESFFEVRWRGKANGGWVYEVNAVKLLGDVWEMRSGGESVKSEVKLVWKGWKYYPGIHLWKGSKATV